jgi:hypothetical protein
MPAPVHDPRGSPDGTARAPSPAYNETYEVDGEWKIKTCTFLEQRSDVTPPKANA